MRRRDFLKGLAALLPAGAVAAEVAAEMRFSTAVTPVVTPQTYATGIKVSSELLDERFKDIFFEHYSVIKMPWLEGIDKWHLTSGYNANNVEEETSD